ncbi:cation-translocating P-type ATPase [Halonotius sp. F2-221B]|uniref:heavy metal translocating P-type ATPase n=1 Tax=Halonotius sp. F2-221B TaxID=2731620 RepID=UPI00398B09C1
MTTCSLCELPTPDPPITDEAVDGEFCCHGCLEVARSVGSLEATSPDDAREELRSDTDPDDLPDEYDEQYLHVDGMHCATCEAFLESTAVENDGVGAATASYATDTLKLHYDPDAVDSDRLPALVSGYGYDATERSLEEDSAVAGDVAVAKFLIGGGFFGMMTMMWYVLFIYPKYFGFEPLIDLSGFDGLYLFTQLWLLASLVLFYTGYPILRGAYVSLKAGEPNMDLLVAVAALGSYGYSTLAMGLGRTDLYFDVTVAIILVVTFGNYYESRIKRRASDLLSELTAIQVDEARRPDGTTVPVAEVQPGDELLVRPGDRIPVDGTVAEGVAAVDEALVTGESIPRTKRPGDFVRGGTVVTDQPLTIEAGEDADSTLDRLVELLWEIQSSSPGVQRFADKLATIFVPLVLTIGAVATVGLIATGASPAAALLTGLTVIIVSCPCALGLATPLAVARGIQTAANHGLVVASDTVFERPIDLDAIALDKTGTLTTGEMEVTETVADDPEAVLSAAAALERAAAHPVADAIVAAAAPETAAANEHNEADRSAMTDGGVATAGWADSAASMGTVDTLERGVRGEVDGADTLVGHRSLFGEGEWNDPEEYLTAADRIAADGAVAVVVGWSETIQGVIAVGDEPKADWEGVVSELAADDREIVVLSGDNEAATQAFGEHPAVDQVFAGVPPEAKAATVRELRSKGRVAMIGDGSNDAPALATADLGIALATGTKLATEAGDVIVADGTLEAVPSLLTIIEKTNSRITQNLGWALCYNAVAIPLAVAGLLNPLLAAVAMGTSSLLVVVNSTLRSLD